MFPDLISPDVTSGFWMIAKLIALFALFMYILFALVILRQVTLMTDTLEVGFEEPVRIFALFHLIFALGTFVAAIVIL